MNDITRTTIQRISGTLNELSTQLDDLQSQINDSTPTDEYDPPEWQEWTNGNTEADTLIDALQAAKETIDSAEGKLDDILNPAQERSNQ
jgi:hypothetical protein